jgi:hypothetical protein
LAAVWLAGKCRRAEDRCGTRQRIETQRWRKIDPSKTSGLGEASTIPIQITAFRKEGQIHERGLTMSAGPRDPEPQFENPEASKLEDETRDDTPQKQMDRVAEKLAQKSTKVEQDSDKDRPIFTK